MIRKYGSTVLGCIGVALWLAALYLLASAAQNSAEFDRWLPWILLINISGLLTLLVLLAGKLWRLVQDYRRHAPWLRSQGAHRGDFQRPGGRADSGGLAYFSLQFINRGIDKLVRAGSQPGIEGHARALACRARSAGARIPATHSGRGAHLVVQSGSRAHRHPGSGAAREYGARIHHRRRAGTDSRHQFRSAHGHPARARDRRNDVAIAARPALREFGHRLGGRLCDSRRGAARCQQRRRPGTHRAVSGAAAAQPARRYGATLLHPVRESGAVAQAAQIDISIDPDLRRADVADRGGVRCILRGAAFGAARAGSDRRHPCRGQGQLRHQAACAVARRTWLSGDLVQRHDQASGPRP